jgi:hypothetical protein
VKATLLFSYEFFCSGPLWDLCGSGQKERKSRYSAAAAARLLLQVMMM